MSLEQTACEGKSKLMIFDYNYSLLTYSLIICKIGNLYNQDTFFSFECLHGKVTYFSNQNLFL